ncbi:hypothetical protein KY331_05480 [Candidatus Woesearchaeota archaeon]|nr:hypothetical protein [Candidatus Woesearchaeota archaeon]
MIYVRKSRLERIIEKIALLPFLFSAGCGTIYRSYGEMVQRGNNIVAPVDFDLDQRITRANRALMRFPNEDKINEDIGTDVVRSVKKYLTPGAKYLLIHARQAHSKKKPSEEDRRLIFNVQREIYLSGDYFTKSKDVRLRSAHEEEINDEIWAGIFIRFFRIIDDMNKYHESLLKEDIRNIEHTLAINPEDRLERLLEEKRRKLKEVQEYEKELYIQGALLKLGAEGKLRVLPGTRYREKHKRDLSFREMIYDKTELKEDIFLEIAANQGGYIIFVVFGGSHAWGGKDSCGDDYDLSRRLSTKDNIAEWNRKNPKDKFSLIELTFQSYQEVPEEIKHINRAINYQE